MRFLLDENVHIGVQEFVRRKGHDIERVPSGTKNGAVLRLAIETSRILLTLDKDFLDAKRYSPGARAAVVCIRIHPPTLDAMATGIEKVLGMDEADILGRSLVLTEDCVEEIR